jgi:hypothetical protein
MVERTAKSQKMAEPHAQAWNARARAALGVRRGTGTRGDTAGAGRERDCGRAQDSGWVGACASRGGWVGRSAHRLVRPLGPGDGRMDPSP